MLELRPERVGLDDFASQPISICGKALVADQAGALYWPQFKTLIVSDLHLEKGSSYAVRGQMLPPYDTRATLVKLAETIDRYESECVIALGDSLHDRGAGERMSAQDREILRLMQEDRRWIWITGNHDREVPSNLGGECVPHLTLGGLTLVHEPRAALVTHEIAGHLHPAARLSYHGYVIRRPCFVGNGRRLVMPAFGTFTGGLNVLDDAFAPLFGDEGLSVWMLGQEGLYPVASRQLKGD